MKYYQILLNARVVTTYRLERKYENIQNITLDKNSRKKDKLELDEVEVKRGRNSTEGHESY